MLTKENKKAIDELLDKLTPLKGILEIALDLALPIGVSQLDGRLLDKIKPEYHNIINEIIAHSLIEKDYAQAKAKLSVLLSEVVTTPLVDGTAEEVATYQSLLDFLQIIIEGLLKLKKDDKSQEVI